MVSETGSQTSIAMMSAPSLASRTACAPPLAAGGPGHECHPSFQWCHCPLPSTRQLPFVDALAGSG